VLAASLLSEGEINIRNFPLALEDVKAKMAFIDKMGAHLIEQREASALQVQPGNVSFDNIDDFDLPIRTTYLLAAGTLARGQRALVPYPGGCKIGSRGYDLHVMVWQQMGCTVVEHPEYIEVTGRLVGAEIDFPISTVGGTENALMCAAVAHGETTIKNAYVTPEVHDLIDFLREMGATVELKGRSLVKVTGHGGLLRSASFNIMPDRIEALTWIVLGAVTRSRLLVRNVPFETMEVPLIHLREAGLDLFRSQNDVIVTPDTIGPDGIQPFELACGTHPGVISDMQSFFSFLGMFANGRSLVYDYRYPERIAYAHELSKFAPSAIEATRGLITTHGPGKLSGASVKSTDLRGSMAVIMAAICAEGASQVDGVELALRGYNDLPGRLRELGVEAEWTA
jgi:UDP-N-acetylglucosamine 1-carboxyvinyltransferase